MCIQSELDTFHSPFSLVHTGREIIEFCHPIFRINSRKSKFTESAGVCTEETTEFGPTDWYPKAVPVLFVMGAVSLAFAFGCGYWCCRLTRTDAEAAHNVCKAGTEEHDNGKALQTAQYTQEEEALAVQQSMVLVPVSAP